MSKAAAIAPSQELAARFTPQVTAQDVRFRPSAHPCSGSCDGRLCPRFPLDLPSYGLTSLAGRSRLTTRSHRESSDRRPIECLAALCNQRYQPMVQQAPKRHGYAQGLCCLKRESDVLQSEWRSEPCGLEPLLRDQSAVDLVDWCLEQR